MESSLKIVTWNIGGAHTIKTKEMFDYNTENLSYFVDIIKALKPDVVCLQESHTNDKDVLAVRMAESLGLAHVFDAPRSPSHIDERYQLSNAILSRHPIETTKNVLL